MTIQEHTRRRLGLVSTFAAVLLLAAVAASAAATARSASTHPFAGIRIVSRTTSRQSRTSTYDWPLKPFDRQHPVRGNLDDPRIAPKSAAFHFGIDIAAPDGTPVYAVEAGTVYFNSPVAIAVVVPDRSRAFGYWHIVPAVKSHQFVHRHELLGYIGKGWEHLHFAESTHGSYLNPLRDGGIGPYRDSTVPSIDWIGVQHGNLVTVAHDSQSIPVPGAWRAEPVTPALLRWRVAGGVWHVAVDFRSTMLPASRFASVYTSATRQNHKGIAGRFSFYLVRGAEAQRLLTGGAPIEVEATDIAGNRVVELFSTGV